MSSMRGKVNSNGSFDWLNAIIDSIIMGGISFVTTLTGIGVAGISAEPKQAVLAAGLAAALGFLTTLSLKRGLTTTKTMR